MPIPEWDLQARFTALPDGAVGVCDMAITPLAKGLRGIKQLVADGLFEGLRLLYGSMHPLEVVMDAVPPVASPTSRNSGLAAAKHDQIPPAAEFNPPAEQAPAVQLPRFVAIVDDYDSLLSMIRVRIRRTNTTYAAIEQTAGMPSNYLSKTVGPRRSRFFGPGLFYLLATLGLRLAIVEDPQLVEKYRNRLEPRERPRLAREHWRWWKRLGASDQSKRTGSDG